jgi:polyhydroxyalkanoate synthesis regulator phasin
MEEEARSGLFEAARKIVLAGIGAVALAQDEIEDFVDRLVERGEIAEKDARKLIKEVTEKRGKAAEREMDKRIEELLMHLNVPTKHDLDELGEKIAVLSAKVEALKN